MTTTTKRRRRSFFTSLTNPPKLYVVAVRGPNMRTWKEASHGPISRARATRAAKTFKEHGVEAKVLPVLYDIDTTALDDEPCKVILRPTNADGRKHPDANKTVRRGPRRRCTTFAWGFNNAENAADHKLGLEAVVVKKGGGK